MRGAKHSPGPWSVFEGELLAAPDEDGIAEPIGRVWRTEAWSSSDDVLSEDQANAALIAAAPQTAAERDRLRKANAEMAAALRMAIDCLVVGDPEREHPLTQATIGKVRQAMAKAEERP